MRALGELRHVEDVLVARRDVPVPGEGDRRVRVLREPARPRRRAAPAARRACSPGAGRRPCGRWARRATRPGPRRRSRRSPAPRRPAGRRTPGIAVEAVLDVLEADPGDDRDAVPLVVRRRSRPRSRAPRGPSSATGRRGPWSPGGRARRRPDAARRPRRGRSGSGRSSRSRSRCARSPYGRQPLRPADSDRSHDGRRPVDSPPVALTIGIVGLPNAGKSTLFNALTKNDVLAANYPFATIEPNVGVVGVPEPRLGELADDLRLRQGAAGHRRVRRHRRHRPGRLGGGGARQQVPVPHPRVRRDLPGDPGVPRRGRHPRGR